MLDEVSNRLKDKDIYIDFDDETEKLLVKKGIDVTYGARPLRRTITRIIEDKLSEEILKGVIKKGDKVYTTVENNELIFKKIN